MQDIVIRKAKPKDSRAFLKLVRELAKFERLKPPSESGKRRLVQDTFRTKRLKLLLAFSGRVPLAYALYFFTYSSFLAKPTLYLEDLFVLETYRGQGIGSRMFEMLIREARRLHCGRIEWAVLTWNSKAIKFYEGIGAHQLKEWHYYRLDESRISKLARKGI